MERHTECFLCISIFVILLPYFARPEECTKIFTTSPGNISDLFYAGEPLTVCQYFVHTPGDHFLLLNITRLIGFASDSLQNCLPRLVIRTASKTKKPISRTICSYSEPLPLVVQSDASKLRLTFYGSSSENSGFSATYTFHTKHQAHSPHLCLSCRYRRDTPEKTVNASQTNIRGSSDDIESNGNNQLNKSLLHLEIVVLGIVTPVAIFCMCAIIIYHCRKKSSCFAETSEMSGHTPRTPSQSDLATQASNSPLLPGTSNFSALQNQELLQEQRKVYFRRSPSTEKFPHSIPLRDEEEPPHIRGQRLNPEIGSDHNLAREGVRGPPNRTVYDSEMYNLDYQKQKTKTEPVRTQCSSQPRGPFFSRSSPELIYDSITHSPIDIDCDEAPPPYSSIVSSQRAPVNNNLLNVCDNSGDASRPSARQDRRTPLGGISSGRSQPISPSSHVEAVGRGGHGD